MNQDSTFMRMALAQAHEAQTAGEIPVGAVVVKDGQVIGIGRNTPIASHDPSAHAEIVAMRAAARTLGNYRLDGCELYVTLEPCSMCAGAMLHARIQRVIYGATDPKTGAAGSVVDLFANPQLNHHTSVLPGVLSDECSTTLRNFFQERRSERGAHAQPLMENALRTPKGAFSGIDDYPFESRFFSNTEALRGWRMHYLDEGPLDSVQVVLCLHNVPGWNYELRHIIRALSEKGIRVIAPDLIGFGMSDKPKKKAVHSLQFHVCSLQSLMLHLNISRVVIVAEAMGVHLAYALSEGKSVELQHLLQMPTDTTDAMDMRPFPDKGHQAALQAIPSLMQELKHSSQDIHKNFAEDVLGGSVDMMANKVKAVFCDG